MKKRIVTLTSLRSDALTHGRPCAETLLHTDIFTVMVLHTCSFAQRRLYTQTLSHTHKYIAPADYLQRVGAFFEIPKRMAVGEECIWVLVQQASEPIARMMFLFFNVNTNSGATNDFRPS